MDDHDIPCECHCAPRVVDSRPRGGYRYRRYKCPQCGARWRTVELLAHSRKGSTSLPATVDAYKKEIKDKIRKAIDEL